VAAREPVVIGDRGGEVGVGLLVQARLQLPGQHGQLAGGGLPRAFAPGARETVPRLGERQQVGAPAASVRGHHRAHTALAVDVGAHDDALAPAHRGEHRAPCAHRQTVDREAQRGERLGASGVAAAAD